MNKRNFIIAKLFGEQDTMRVQPLYCILQIKNKLNGNLIEPFRKLAGGSDLETICKGLIKELRNPKSKKLQGFSINNLSSITMDVDNIGLIALFFPLEEGEMSLFRSVYTSVA